VETTSRACVSRDGFDDDDDDDNSMYTDGFSIENRVPSFIVPHLTRE